MECEPEFEPTAFLEAQPASHARMQSCLRRRSSTAPALLAMLLTCPLLSTFLEGIGLDRYLPVFAEHEVDMETIWRHCK